MNSEQLKNTQKLYNLAKSRMDSLGDAIENFDENTELALSNLRIAISDAITPLNVVLDELGSI